MRIVVLHNMHGTRCTGAMFYSSPLNGVGESFNFIALLSKLSTFNIQTYTYKYRLRESLVRPRSA